MLVTGMPVRHRGRWPLALVLATVALALPTPSAKAGPGYELDPVKSSIGTAGEISRGVAIDQASQLLYVTTLISGQSSGPGQIEQFDSSGVPTENSPFVTGATDFYVGVAVNQATHDIYAYQTELRSPFGSVGAPRIDIFSSVGVLGSSFTPIRSAGAQIAVDSSGRVYYPSEATDTVQVFNAAGTLQDSISCAGCPGGSFAEPASVAFDSSGNLYVVDLAAGGRALKFKSSGGTYVYDSMLQGGGKGAVAVGVDPSSDDVFVGDWAEGTFHVVAYNSSGVQFDDFGGGIFASPEFDALAAGQIAVNATTRKVYVADSGADKVWIFDRVASILAPTASTLPASSLGQVEANLNASVNPNAHGLSECQFEYTDDADFEANGFANATAVPCFTKPVGSTPSAITWRVTGLEPATEYDYRIAVASNGGSAMGVAQGFETLPPLPPTVTTGSASAITQTKATFDGSVNPHGGPISECQFEYTDEVAFQEKGFMGADSTECMFLPEGTASSPVSTDVTGLTAGTEYRFRVVATNNSGTTEGVDQPFATLAETCATNPALCPPPPKEETKPPVQPSPLPVTPPPAATPPPKALKCRKGFRKKLVRGKPKCVKKKRRRHSR